MGVGGVRDDLLGEGAGPVQVAQQRVLGAVEGVPGQYASTRAVVCTVCPGTEALPTVKVPVVSSVPILMPAPAKRTIPARDRACSWRSRNPGGPEARKLKKPCHQPSSPSATERADSLPPATRRGSWP
ncbi:hypothetical protein SFUMM280S_06224 [Streptomyces fumanus]